MWEPPEGLGNAQKLVEECHRQDPDMPELVAVE